MQARLQQAGNRATAEWVADQREQQNVPHVKQVPYHQVRAQLAVGLLHAMQRGDSYFAMNLLRAKPEWRSAIHVVQESLLRAIHAVNYWCDRGCFQKVDGGYELIRPCPASVIAGWIPDVASSYGDPLRMPTLIPTNPDFLPTPPTDAQLPQPDGSGTPVRGDSSKTGPVKAIDANLRTDDALTVATYMLERHLVSGQWMLSAGIREPKRRDLAMSIADHLLRHRRVLASMTTNGVRSRAADGLVRPAPPEVIAMLLGIGPPDNPELKAWSIE
jgi:hypothetical protein